MTSMADRLRSQAALFSLCVLGADLIFLLILDEVAPASGIVGIPGSVLVSSVVLVSMIAGTWYGVVLAAGNGLLMWVLLQDHGVTRGTGLVSLVMWAAVALLAGELTDRLRREISLRQKRLSESREQAQNLSADLSRILDLAPRFHTERDLAGAGLEICSAARSAFSLHAASLLQVEGDRLRLLARDPSDHSFEPGNIYSPPPNGRLPSSPPLEQPLFTADLFEASAPAMMRSLAGEGERSLLTVPLTVGGASYYVLVLSWREVQSPPEPGFLALVQRFADQAAAALSRVEALELHGRMEAGLYPRLPLRIPGVSVDVRFRAREQLLTMGGDFFGLIGRPGGGVAFVMGDVSGHGPDSAALGATLRASWRALAMAGADLETTLDILDTVVINDRRVDRTFVTLLAGLLDPVAGVLELANVAHPPPILATGSAEFLDPVPTPPLGFSSDAERPLSRLQLPGDWRLLLYTDGLFEGRSGPGSSRRFGLEWLMQRVREAPVLDGAFLDALLAEIQRAQGGPLLDDVVAMVLSPGAGVDAEGPDPEHVAIMDA